ncbi:MAG: glycosyltransferase family 9 protein [Kiritimatiellia bacterium]
MQNEKPAAQQKKNKILIIKLGYSETLVPYVRQTCSLGDVFRTTAILHLFKDDHVTWLTDQTAIPLLEGNPDIARILPFNLLSVLLLERERFDKVINLEKVPGICALAGRIHAWAHFGFRWEEETGEAEAYDRAYEALAVATKDDVKKLNNRSWTELLFEMLGAKWNGESYILGYRPNSVPQYDLGFNFHVGELLPVKAWPIEHWQTLAQMVAGKYSVTWQQGLDDLRAYCDWINTCRILITNDSLGLFLGIALGKKVLGLFGPTAASEHPPHPNLRTLTPPLQRDCMPCCQPTCALNDLCMQYITPEMVLQAIEEWDRE